jgi:hypothetical protein
MMLNGDGWETSLQCKIYHVRDESRSSDLDMWNWLLHFNFHAVE